MRILSKFHDYYDCIQGLGQDQTLVYVREPFSICSKCNEQIPQRDDKYIYGYIRQKCPHCKSDQYDTIQVPGFPKVKDHFTSYWNRKDSKKWRQEYQELVTYFVGIAGKVYPVLRLSSSGQKGSTYCHKIEDVDEFMKEHYTVEQYNCYESSTNKKIANRSPKSPLLKKNVRNFFDEAERVKEHYEKYFVDNNAPVFINFYEWGNPSKYGHIYNANLADLQFYKVMDPQTVFQEISMYLSGVLGLSTVRGKPSYQGEKLSDKVSDEDLAAAKGYDKWSFRKEPKSK